MTEEMSPKQLGITSACCFYQVFLQISNQKCCLVEHAQLALRNVLRLRRRWWRGGTEVQRQAEGLAAKEDFSDECRC
jgi:hypothetical protein